MNPSTLPTVNGDGIEGGSSSSSPPLTPTLQQSHQSQSQSQSHSSALALSDNNEEGVHNHNLVSNATARIQQVLNLSTSMIKPPTPAPSPQPRSRAQTRESIPPPQLWTSTTTTTNNHQDQEEEDEGSSVMSETELIAYLRFQINNQLSLSSRQQLLTLLINDSSPSTLSPLIHLITPRLKRDFLKTLPIELSFHVLSFVDEVKTLARASGVSRFWRALLEDETTWKRMCWKSGFGNAPQPPQPQPRAPSPSPPIALEDYSFGGGSSGVGGGGGRMITKDLEFGKLREPFSREDEIFTPAGRERRGTLDRTGLQEFAARAELFDLPVAVRRGSSSQNTQTNQTQRRDESNSAREREGSWSDAPLLPSLTATVEGEPEREEEEEADSGVQMGLGFTTSVISTTNDGGNNSSQPSTSSRRRSSVTTTSSRRRQAPTSTSSSNLPTLVSPPMFSLPGVTSPSAPPPTSEPMYEPIPTSSTSFKNSPTTTTSTNPSSCNSHPNNNYKDPFSYKTHFKRAYLTESSWLRGPGRLLSTQMSADDGVVTSLGFDEEWIVVGMATSKIHVFESGQGRYVRSLEGHELGVWCLTLIGKSGSDQNTPIYNNNKKGKGRMNEEEDDSEEQEEEIGAGRGGGGGGFSGHTRSNTSFYNKPSDLPSPHSRRRRRSFPSTSVPSSPTTTTGTASNSTPSLGGMGLGAGGRTGDSLQQSGVCSTARGWGQTGGARVVSGGCDREVRVWDVETGECLHTLRGHTSTVRCMRVLDGRPIAVSGSRDSTLRVWDIERGECLHLLSGHEHSVRCIEVSGNKVVSGSYDATCRLWDVDTGECLHVFRGHIHQIYAVAFDGIRVVTGSLDSTVRIWSAETGEFLALLQGHTSLVGQLILLPSSQQPTGGGSSSSSSSSTTARRRPTLVTGGSDGRVIVFDLETFDTVHRLCAHDNSVTCLQVDERFIVTGGNDGRIKLWDFKTGQFVRELIEPCGAVWRVVFRDDKCVTLCRREGKTLMDVRTFRPTEEELYGDST